MSRYLLALGLGAALSSIFACHSDTSGVPCSDELCPSGQHCVNGLCTAWDGGSGLDSSRDKSSPVLDGQGKRETMPSELGPGQDGSSPQDASTLDAPGDAHAGDSSTTDGSTSSDGKSDAPVDVLAPDTCGVPCGGLCCAAPEQCIAGMCLTPLGTCTTHDDCFGDSYCYNGLCLPYGSGPLGVFNPTCLRVIPAGMFEPTMQCEWKGPAATDPHPNHKNVLGTPVVIDFANQGEGAPPSIAFVSYDRLDGGSQSSWCDQGAFGVIRVIRGTDCNLLWTVEGIKVRASSPLAVGDLDGDQKAEIVAYQCGGGVVAIKFDPIQQKFVQLWATNQASFPNKDSQWAGPSIHDLDNDGKPEILMGGIVFDNTGKVLDSSLGTLSPTGHPGGFGVAADLDGDGKPELVNGANVWEFQASTRKWTVQVSTTNPTGLVAVADFGTYGADPAKDDRTKLDGVAEVAVVRNGTVVVQTIAGRVLFGPVSLPGGGAGGPPTIGDFDSDGRAELACAGRGSYSVFDPDCKVGTVAAVCPSLATNGILWSQTSKDYSSSSTGSSIFDFEGDGAAEAIYADECFARVYEGKTGEVLFSQYHTSDTWYENPVVADVDRDFQSELVVPSNINEDKYTECSNLYAKSPSGKAMDPLFKGFRCKTGTDCPGGVCSGGFCRCTQNSQCGTLGSYECAPPVTGTPGTGNVCRSVMLGGVTGVRVYRDVQDRWVDSRPIWNQHAYSVTNVEDNGVIPSTSSWLRNWVTPGMNNFRQNQQGALNPSSVPDLTSNLSQGVSCAAGGMTIHAQLCNRGTKSVGAGVKLGVYLGDPQTGGKLGCTAATTKVLAIGLCQTVSCTISPPPTTAVDLHLVADDDGTGHSAYVECFEKNNRTVLKNVTCP